MYGFFLYAHSWLRWLVVIAIGYAIVRGVRGWSGRTAWTPAERVATTLFVVSVDIQVLIGLALFLFLSPLTQAAFQNVGGAMSDRVLRYFLVEHNVIMVLAFVAAHVGQVMIRRATSDQKKFRILTVAATVALVAILIGMPWPFMAAARPLFRF